jgi:hypothetical protein
MPTADAKSDVVWLQASKAHKVYYAPCLCEAARAIDLPMLRRGCGPAIVWHDELPFSPSVFKHLPQGSVLNRLNGMQAMARKAYLTVMIRFLQTLFPERFEFYPESWCLPSEFSQFLESAKAEVTYIVKPDGGCRGRDIILVRGDQEGLPELLSASSNAKQSGARAKQLEFVVQEYIDPPRLIGAHKFDVRIYVLIESICPLRACIGTKALVRIASVPYESATAANLNETRMHLTNASLIEADGTVGVSELEQWKREWTESVAEIGVDADDLWQQFRTIVTRTLIAMQPYVVLCTESEKPLSLGPVPEGRRLKQLHKMFFQLLGFDIMVNQVGQAALLEVNHNPSFAVTTPLDRRIKVPILAATLARVQTRLRRTKVEPDTSVLEELCFRSDEEVLLAVEQVTRVYQRLTASACTDVQGTCVPAELVRRLASFLAKPKPSLSSALLRGIDSKMEELSFRAFISALMDSNSPDANGRQHVSDCVDLITRFLKSEKVQAA